MSSQGQAVAVTAGTVSDLERFRQLGRWLSLAELDSETAESRGAAAALRFALADALNVSPTAALTELSFIHGRLNLSAQLVRAMAAREGYRVKRVELTDERCTAALVELATGELLGEVTYTMEDARTAGLIRDRSGWKSNPQRMLWARASKRVVDDFAPEVSLGITTPEEEEEIALAGYAAADDPPPFDPEPEAEVVDATVVDDDGEGLPDVPDEDAAPEPELPVDEPEDLPPPPPADGGQEDDLL